MEFRGLYTAMISPFCHGGRQLDWESYRHLIERQIAAGVAGIIPCGTTGESPTLSHTEHHELIARTVEYVAGRTKVIAGTGSNSTEEAIELTEAACKEGTDAVMLVSPYYNKPTQDGLRKHFSKIADRSSVPVILYNIAGRTGVNIEVETLQYLAEHERIQAVKEASGDVLQMIRLKKICGDKLSLLCGDDNITPAFMGLGGQGIVSVASNIYPKRLARILSLYSQGDFAQANKVFYEFLDFMNALFWQTNPIPVKAAAALVGLCQGDLRLPLIPMKTELRERLKRIIKQIGEDA